MATKLNPAVVQQREDFMKGLFRVDPDLTAAKAVERFQKHFGVKMKPARVYALRKLVRTENKKNGGAQQVAARSAEANLELVRVTQGHEAIAWDLMKVLADKGLMTARPFEKGNGYIVIELP